jgi:hypothetical protein
VFKDLDSMEPGADFVEVIEETVARCDALLAVIGRDWLATREGGERRLDDPEDWVRLEIANALERRIRVVPVLVQRAPMPSAADLPEDLRVLARRHAVELSESAWAAQVNELLDGLERAVPRLRRPAVRGSARVRAGKPSAPSSSRRTRHQDADSRRRTTNASTCAHSEQASQRTEVEVEVLVREAERALELLHAGLERHERPAETLDRLVVEVARLHAPERLALHELAQELDDRQHELGEPPLDVLGIGVDAGRQRVVEPPEVARERVEIERRGQELLTGRIVHRGPPTIGAVAGAGVAATNE